MIYARAQHNSRNCSVCPVTFHRGVAGGAVISVLIVIKLFKLINYEKSNDFIHLNDECVVC